MIDRLIDDHCRILAIASRLEAELTPRPPKDGTRIALLRSRLLTEVLRHTEAEDRILEQSRAQIDARETLVFATPGAADQQHACTAMIRAHVLRWTGRCPISAWAEFRASLLPLLAALRQRIAFEEDGLYPELRMLGSIDQPPADFMPRAMGHD